MSHRFEHIDVQWHGEWRCPVCGSENISVDDSFEEGDNYTYEMYCDDCDAEFNFYYDMVPSSLDYVTKEEQQIQDEQRRMAYEGAQAPIPIPEDLVRRELPPDIPAPPPLTYEPIRHNYDLAKIDEHVSDNPLLDVLSEVQAEVAQCQRDTATRNLLIPHANWQAINQALNES